MPLNITTIVDGVRLTPSAGTIRSRMDKVVAGTNWRNEDDWFNTALFPCISKAGDHFFVNIIASANAPKVNGQIVLDVQDIVYPGSNGVNFTAHVSAPGFDITPDILSRSIGLLCQHDLYITFIQDRKVPMTVGGASFMLAMYAACAGWPPLAYTGLGIRRAGTLYEVEEPADLRQKVQFVTVEEERTLVIATEMDEGESTTVYSMVDLLRGAPFNYEPIIFGPTIPHLMSLVYSAAVTLSKSFDKRSALTNISKMHEADTLDALGPDEFAHQALGTGLNLEWLQRVASISKAKAHELGMSVDPSSMAESVFQMYNNGIPRNLEKFKAWITALTTLDKKNSGGDTKTQALQKKKVKQLFAVGGPKESTELIQPPNAKKLVLNPFRAEAPKPKVTGPAPRQKSISLMEAYNRAKLHQGGGGAAPAATASGANDDSEL